MFHRKQVKILLVQLGALLIIWPCLYQCLIITSVIAGDKKFKTISFESKFLKPLMFEKELPNTEFRRHRTVRPPKFDIDVNIPIKLPLEDEYAPEEYKKPVYSNIQLETGELVDKNYGKYAPKSKHPQWPTSKINFKESLADYAAAAAAASSVNPTKVLPPVTKKEAPQRRLEMQPIRRAAIDERPQQMQQQQQQPQQQQQQQQQVELRRNSYHAGKQYQADYEKQPEFVPGGFVNLQLSGPTGGPKMTYADFDREKWAQQLSQTAGAMPYPILNYHQLQNFYGGLGTFTNGLAENRYTYEGPIEKMKKMLAHFG